MRIARLFRPRMGARNYLVAWAKTFEYGEGMTLEAIKDAIAQLPEDDKTSLASWLNAQDNEAWSQQIEADFSEGGAGTALLEQWDAEIRSESR